MSLGDRFDHTQAVPAVLSALSTPEGVRRCARVSTAGRSLGVEDCRVLLDMLGLDFSDEEVAAFERRAVNDTVIQAVDETGDLQ